MRIRKTGHGLTVNATAGTNVVLLGFDLKESKRPGCLGFAIQREDHTEDERAWLRGMKTFPSTDPARPRWHSPQQRAPIPDLPMGGL